MPKRSFIYDPHLVLYLPLWQLDGDSFMSDDVYGHLCTVTGATWGLQGRTFNGTTSTLAVTHNANQLLTTGGTIEAWINPNSIGENTAGTFVDKSTNFSGAAGFALWTHVWNNVLFVINGASGIESAQNSIVYGNWHHVAVTWDATGLVTIYVNGAQSGTPGISADPVAITTTNALTIGNRSGATDRTFDGVIGEVRVYNRALSLIEIQNHWLNTKWRYQG